MNKIITYIIILLLLNFTEKINSQTVKIDSLNKLLEKVKNDTVEADILLQLGHSVSRNTSIYYYKKALLISEKASFNTGIFLSSYNLGDSYYRLCYFNLSEEYVEKAFLHKKGNVVSKQYIGLLSLKSLLSTHKGKYGKALKFVNKAIVISEKYNFNDLLPSLYNIIGGVYGKINEEEQALEYYDKTFEYYKKNKDTIGIADYYINTGVIFTSLKDFEKALSNYNKALNIYIEKNDIYRQSICLENIGDDFLKQGQFEKAYEYLNKAYKKSKSIDDVYGMASVLKSLGELFFKQKQYSNSIEKFTESLKYIDKIGEDEMARQIHKNISEAYSYLSLNKKALFHYKKYKALNDSILISHNNVHIAELNAERNELKLQLENKELKDNLKGQKETNDVLIYLIIPMLILGLILTVLFLKLKKQEQEIKEQEQDFEALLEANTDVVVMTSTTGKLLYINNVIKEMLGYEKEEVIGKNIKELVPNRDRRILALDKLKEILVRRKLKAFETSIKHKDGSFVSVEISGRIIRYKGKMVAVGTIRDISERVKTEKKYLDTEGRFKALSEATNEGVLISENGIIKDANSAVSKIVGYPLSELIGASALSFISEKSLNEVKCNMDIDYTEPYDAIAKRKDGNEIDIEIHGKIAEQDGNSIRVVAIRDITERKEAERIIKESEEKYRVILENSPDVVFLIDKFGYLTFISENVENIMGWEVEDVVGKHISKFVPKKSLAGYMTIIKDVFKNKKITQYRTLLYHKKGYTVHVEISGRIMEYQGKAVGIGTYRDITEKIEAEQLVKESEERYKLIVDNTLDVVFMIDKLGFFTFISDNSIKFGWNPKEVVGKHLSSFVPKTELANYLFKLKKAFTDKEIDGYISKVKHKNGREITVRISGKVLKIKGKYLGLGSFRDISETEEAERRINKVNYELNEQIEKYNLLSNNITDLIWMINEKNELTYISPSVEMFIGYTIEEIKNMSSDKFYTKKSRTEIRKAINEVFLNRDDTSQRMLIVDYIHKNGNVVTAEVSAQLVLNREGGVLGLAGVSRDISKRIEMEKALKENERNNKYLVENLSVGIIINDTNETFTMANKAAKKIFGTRKLVGKNLADFVDIEIYNLLKEKTYERQAGKKEDYDIEITTEYGHTKVINVKAIPNFAKGGINGTIAIFTDVTEERKMVDNLMRSEENYRKLFDSSPISLWEEDYSEIKKQLDKKRDEGVSDMGEYIKGHPEFVDLCQSLYRVVNINKETVKLFKANSKQHLFNNLSKIFSTSATHFLIKLIIAFFEDIKKFDSEISMKDLKGNKIVVHIKLFVFDNYKRVIVSMSDITHRKSIEKQLMHSKKEAQESNRLKSQFLANMSHEIRTPMNAIIGFSDILYGRLKDERHRLFVKRIMLSGNNLLRLINDILDLSKIEAGELTIQKDIENIRELLNNVNQMFIEKVKEKHLSFNVNIQDNVPSNLIIDQARLSQIIINLVSNAIKFTEYGGVSIIVEAENINNDKLDLLIYVRDTGIGIPEDQQGIIFETFRQVAGQKVKLFGGTGLGLSITKNLTEMMGGKISVKSNTEGTEFKVCLYNVAISLNSLNYETIEYKDIGFNENSAKILYADDNLMNIEVIKAIAETEGDIIIAAEDGEQVLEILKTVKPDIILLDIQMPKMDGYETANAIRQMPEFDEIPLIALSANVDIKKQTKFDSQVSKPITVEMYKEQILKFKI